MFKLALIASVTAPHPLLHYLHQCAGGDHCPLIQLVLPLDSGLLLQLLPPLLPQQEHHRHEQHLRVTWELLLLHQLHQQLLLWVSLQQEHQKLLLLQLLIQLDQQQLLQLAPLHWALLRVQLVKMLQHRSRQLLEAVSWSFSWPWGLATAFFYGLGLAQLPAAQPLLWPAAALCAVQQQGNRLRLQT
jgi:hypothetical protein